jgi:hypothetical protein
MTQAEDDIEMSFLIHLINCHYPTSEVAAYALAIGCCAHTILGILASTLASA